ncbi:hypothetical protein [Helicobacter cetorum]|uniref:hypothetical protein n=1 Tax=Helicobacter cetorum TaxID=138563 RepID=UPI000CF07D93|nr:hypothetical protein [Helicobacter cetorum]
MNSLVEKLEIKLDERKKVDIKIDNKELLEIYTKAQTKRTLLRVLLGGFVFLCLCVTMAYIFKGF